MSSSRRSTLALTLAAASAAFLSGCDETELAAPRSVSRANVAAASAYGVVQLASTPGVVRSEAWAINRGGDIAVQEFQPGGQRAVLHTADGVLVQNPDDPAVCSTAPLGLNRYRASVGLAYCGQATYAFRWAPGGRNIFPFATPTRVSTAYAVNDAGWIAGILAPAENGPANAVVWTPDGGLVKLGTFGGTFSFAFDVNNLGQVVGESAMPPGSPDRRSRVPLESRHRRRRPRRDGPWSSSARDQRPR